MKNSSQTVDFSTSRSSPKSEAEDDNTFLFTQSASTSGTSKIAAVTTTAKVTAIESRRKTIKFSSASISGSRSVSGTGSATSSIAGSVNATGEVKPAPHARVIAIKLKALKEKFTLFVKYVDYQLDQLPDNIHTELNGLARLSAEAFGSNAYENIMRVRSEVFGSLTKTKSGSVGEWFTGCFIKSVFPGNPACSSECAGKLPAAGQTFCDTFVATYKKSTLIVHHSPATISNTVLIHVRDKFCRLTVAEVKELGEMGITKAILSHYNDGEYESEQRTINVKLLCPELQKKPITGTMKSTATKTKTSIDDTKTVKGKSTPTPTSSPKLKPDTKSGKKPEANHKKAVACPRNDPNDVDNDHNDGSDGSGPYLLFLIFIIFIIFIICFIALYCSRSNQLNALGYNTNVGSNIATPQAGNVAVPESA